MLKPRYLIVGQGLVGTVLAHELELHGIQPVLVDNHHHHCASKIAAGLFNPFIFKYITKSWLVDELLPVMHEKYHAFEQQLHRKLLHTSGLVRVISSESEKIRWQKKGSRPDFAQHLGPDRTDLLAQGFDHGYGNKSITSAGWLDIHSLLDGYRKYLLTENRLLQESFEHNLLVVDEVCTYKGQIFDQVIFCEGAAVDNNPYFNHLPFRHTKGEILDITTTNIELDSAMNFGQFIIPIEPGKFRVGTTYHWENLDPVPTPEAAENMLDNHEKFFGSRPEISNHRVGIRPTAADRRPFIGRHPQHPSLAILNATGSKGVLLAPWSARQLVNHLLNNQPLHPEVDLNRFR